MPVFSVKRMQLNKVILPSLAAQSGISIPTDCLLQLPEKVLQFGTGVLLRGLPDYYINEANRYNVFNGRIVIVKSTGKGSGNEFAVQNNLYTHCIKGVEDNVIKENCIINAAISRVINANSHWQQVLQCAHNPQLQIIISNTTEVGIALLEDDNIQASPPQSFPGKLLAFLHERYKAFVGTNESGMIIIPTELMVDNGKKLKDIVIRLAQLNRFEESFIHWLVDANDWCSSLVDRIVPGALPEKDKQQLEQVFGYTDDIAIMSEPYNLWAIETESERTKQLLSFSNVNKGIIITGNIEKYRELKLRLLNATHTFSCGLAFLSQFNTVNEAMQDKIFHQFINELLYEEIIPCIISKDITKEEARDFAGNVLSRFSNPFIRHQWLSITLQYTSKMKTRCVPLIEKYCQQNLQPQSRMALGFAAYLLFMKATTEKDNNYFGVREEEPYLVQDAEAKRFYQLWQNNEAEQVVSQALSDAGLWGKDLTLLSHFKNEVTRYLQQLLSGIDLEKMIYSTSRKK